MDNPVLFYSRDGAPVTRSAIESALRLIGAGDADVLYIHTGMDFGTPNIQLGRKGLLTNLLDILINLGVPNLIWPSYTFSFCNNEIFDLDNTPSPMGAINEFVRRQKDALRSADPLLSNVMLGPEQGLLTEIAHDSIGAGSTFDLLHLRGGRVKFLFFGTRAKDCFTFSHYVEERLAVPYRYRRPLTGTIIRNGQASEQTYYLFMRFRGVHATQQPVLEQALRSAGILHETPLGNTLLQCIPEAPAYAVIAEEIRRNIDFMLSAPYPRHELVAEFIPQKMVAL